MRRGGVSKAMRRALACARMLPVLAAPALGAARDARAEEPVTSAEPRLMRETGEMTSVVDAFDEGDPFDVNISLGFRYRSRSAPIEREGVGGLTRLGTFKQGVSTLDIGADVGLFRDVALLLRLPLILNDSRSLDAVGQEFAVPGGQNETLFNTPFTSPTRSGVDDIGIGIDAGLFNQERDPRQPTWVVGVEARLAMGTALHACNQDAAVPCPDPRSAATSTAGTTSRDPGVSRAVNTVRAHTVLSRRFGSLEPFAGFRGQVSFAESRSDYGSDSAGTADQSPPWLATALLGVEVIPWEHREQFQRLVGLLRASGTYHARGRDYSELFDALGSSTAPSLRAGSPTAYHGLVTGGATPTATPAANGQPASVADSNAPLAYFTGISSVEAHADLELAAEGTWQAGETIKFALGGAMTFTEGHLVTGADACNARAPESAASAGPCGVNGGTPNPQERDAVDVPGHRFRVGVATTFDVFIRGVVMF